MKAQEFIDRHLRREARDRTRIACRLAGMTTHETSKALAKIEPAPVPTIEQLNRQLAVCAYVIEHADNYPSDLVEEMKISAAWKREAVQLLRANPD